MNTFYGRQTLSSASLQPTANLLQSKPARITFTAFWQLRNTLQWRADQEGVFKSDRASASRNS
jgi:hypothetical protein